MIADAYLNDEEILGDLLVHAKAVELSPRRQARAKGQSAGSVTASEVHRLLRRGENSRLAFAAEVHDPVALARLIAALANTAGGCILIGVEPPATIRKYELDRAEHAYHAALKHLSPQPRTELHVVQLGQHELAIVRVGHANRLILASGGAFRRNGSQTVPLTPAEITQLALQPVESGERSSALTAKSAPASGELEMLMRATLAPLARAIAEQTRIIERLQQDLAHEVSLQNRMKEWLAGAVLGAIVGQIVASIFG